MFPYLSDFLRFQVIANGSAITSSGGTIGNLVDISTANGPILIAVMCPSGGTNTMTIQPVMNTSNSNVGCTNVPAADILIPSVFGAGGSGAIGTVYTPGATNLPGLPTTFPTVGTVAYFNWVAINRQNIQRYLGLAVSGTSLTQTLNAWVATTQAYTS